MSTLLKPRRALVLMVAMDVLDKLREERREWEEEATRHWANGFRPEYCPHGSYMWGDWDPMCLRCEYGITLHQEALEEARCRVNTWTNRCKAMQRSRELDMPMDLERVIEWVTEPIRMKHEAVLHRLGAAA